MGTQGKVAQASPTEGLAPGPAGSLVPEQSCSSGVLDQTRWITVALLRSAGEQKGRA